MGKLRHDEVKYFVQGHRPSKGPSLPSEVTLKPSPSPFYPELGRLTQEGSDTKVNYFTGKSPERPDGLRRSILSALWQGVRSQSQGDQQRILLY